MTEKKKASQDLIKSLPALKIIDSMGDGISIQDTDFKIIYQNRAHIEMVGGDFVGEYCYKVYARSDNVCRDCPVVASFKDGNVHSLIKYAPSDRTVPDIEIKASPLRDLSGNIIAGIEIVRDISERVRAEVRLAESETRYRDLFDNAHDMIQSVGSDGKFIYVNDSWLKVMGYSREELERVSMFDILHPDCMGHCMELFKKVISGEPQKNIEAVFIAKDGSKIEVEGNVGCRVINDKVVATHGIFRDVTDKKKAEKALQESEQKYRSLFENATDSIFIIDPFEGRFVDCNTIAAKRLGYTREEVLSMKVFEINPADESAGIKDRFKKQLLGESITFETVHIRKNGSSMPVEVSTRLIDYGGQRVLLAFARDITKRKEAEQSLIFNEERYRSLVESTEDSIYLVDKDYRYLFMNKHHLSRLGISKDDYSGRAYGDFHSEEDTKEFTRLIDSVFRTGESSQQEYKGVKGDMYFLRTLSPVKDKEGRVVAVTVISKNITDRKEFEYELQLNEERYRSLVESTDDSIYLVDKNYRYLFMNKQHMARLNLTDTDYTNLSYLEIHSAKESSNFLRLVDEVFETGRSVHEDHKSLRDNKYFLRTLSPVRDKEGKIVAVTVVSKNITDRKKMEEDLRTLAITDELTGLYNRRGFLTLAGQQLKLANRLNRGVLLFYADLNDLKIINDKYGHHEGDKAIEETADLLREVFRESDIIARIGGDEFVVFPVQITDSSTETLNSRFKEHLDAFNEKRDSRYRLSISIGIVHYEKYTGSIEQLLVEADKLMYEQKKNRQKR
jgi:diguanylate cyclase (GGDEF)-like protein/PAS domain S-box-containing protein